MGSDHPLLAPFFETGTGFVLYKGYPPQRGDDVTALLALASALPEGVQFAPVPPRWNTVTDLRYLLPDLLWDLRKEITQIGNPLGNAGTSESRPGDVATPEDLQAAEEILKPMLRQALVQMNPEANADSALEVLRSTHPELLEVMLRTIATNPENLQRAHALAKSEAFNRLAQRDMLRATIHLPHDVPILIVGRPELFLGYYPWTAEHEKTDLRRMLDSAGYPGRYHFADDRYAEWLEAAPTIRDPRPPAIRDRKTFRVYSLKPEGRRREDVGFVLASRTPHGQIVMVATGSTSLGTFAAVQLLLQNRRGFAESIEKLRSGEHTVAVDLGFRCRVETADDRGHVPRPRRTERLSIELLNPGDMAGYSWGRQAYEIVRPILAGSRKLEKLGTTTKEKLGTKPYVHWEWRGGESALTRVGVTARPYKISSERTIYPSADFGRLLERISTDLEVDKQNWLRRLNAYPPPRLAERDSPDYIKAINSNSSFRTFRPILLLGATGTGKEWIAEMIAAQWGGTIVGNEPEEYRAEHFQARQSRRLDFHPIAEREWLPPRLRDWMERAANSRRTEPSRNIHALSVVETPESLLGSQLFGIVQGTATDVEAQLSAFVVAGTGVLFLDELLELESSLQARLLVALQTGKVMPVGSAAHHPYFCRIVAATNRAEDEADLRSLTTQHEVRSDLVARFSRRYEIPRLENRPLEIVPILISTLLTERGSAETTSLYLRISRPALELMLTYSYPENIRQLQAFAFSLPDDLVQALYTSQSSDNPEVLAKTSIMLEHMTSFGVGKGDIHSGLGISSYIDVSLEPEKEFYEFSFPALFRTSHTTDEELKDAVDDGPIDKPSDEVAALPKASVDLIDWLKKPNESFKRMCDAAKDVKAASDLTRLLRQNTDFRSGLTLLVTQLLEAHEAMRQEDPALGEDRKYGLGEGRMSDVLRRVPPSHFPLSRLPKEFDPQLMEWAQSEEVISIVKQAAQGASTTKSTGGGRRPTLHRGVLAGFLTGRYDRRR